MAGKKGMKHYSLELKLEAMRMFYEEGRTRKEITETLGIRDKDRVMKWLRQYRREGKDAFLKKQRRLGRRPKKENTKAYIARLEMEVVLLKKIPYRVAQGTAREAQYRIIYRYREKYTVKAMCTFFGVSRAAYYAWVKRTSQPDPDAERMALVQETYDASHQTYGYRRIQLWIEQKRGVIINHKAVLKELPSRMIFIRPFPII